MNKINCKEKNCYVKTELDTIKGKHRESNKIRELLEKGKIIEARELLDKLNCEIEEM